MHEHDFRTEELLAEELTSEEVRELLERLNARDMGGAENATLGAVAEATGSDPILVGRLLGEIRKEDFEERFGLQLDHHERRIETLEAESKRRSVTPPPRRAIPVYDTYQQIALDRLAEQEKQKEAMRPIAIVVLAAMALVLLIVLFAATGTSKTPGSTPVSVGYGVSDGTVYKDQNGKVWVELKSGGERPATPEETSHIDDIALRHGL